MAIEAAILTRFAARPALVVLVAARIYPDRLPQNVVYPAVRYYELLGAERVSAFGADTGLVRTRFQFDAYAIGALAANNVRDELRRALQRWRQAGPPEVQGTFIESTRTLPESEDAAADEKLFRRVLEATVIWRET